MIVVADLKPMSSKINWALQSIIASKDDRLCISDFSYYRHTGMKLKDTCSLEDKLCLTWAAY